MSVYQNKCLAFQKKENVNKIIKDVDERVRVREGTCLLLITCDTDILYEMHLI